MPAIQSTVTNKRFARWIPPSKTQKDAIRLLTEGHFKIKEMFREFEELRRRNCIKGKEELMVEICRELTVHTQLEQEIFYPAAREAIKDDLLVDEIMVERSCVKNLIWEIQSLNTSDPMYEAIVAKLNEYINHHMEKQENTIFPKVLKSKIDLVEIGSDMAVCKKILMEDWI